LVATLSAVVFIAGCGGDSDGAPPEAGADCVDLRGSPTALIIMLDNSFNPACFKVSRDQSLTLRNEGVALHDFKVEGSDVDLDVRAGEETTTEAIGGVLEPGSYKVTCTYHLPVVVAEMEVL
jgi:plastocyanin